MSALETILIISAVLFVITVIAVVAIVISVKKSRDREYDRRNTQFFSRRRYLSPQKLKGEEGERRVRSVLGENIDGEKYVINKFTIEYGFGNSFDIDHICINRCGIWVIETKNWAGAVYGDKDGEKWLQVCGRCENTHNNPIKQNQAHLSKLKNCMGIKKRIYHNVVVFAGDADIHIESDEICYLSELNEHINKGSDFRLSSTEMREYYKKLVDLNTRLHISEDMHIRNMSRDIAEHCPLCGAELTVQHSYDGTYYICVNDRRCGYKKKISKGWDE